MDALYVTCTHVSANGHKCTAPSGQFCEERFQYFHPVRLIEAEFEETDFTPQRCVDYAVESVLLS